ncbi:hypothetical protein AAG570_002911 [Ranatra chinensis]|uniref:Uncharacterized protein n=1 Tax=Ranatra chinensis TaxID=642074 RepID=A0ABD0Y578_9HEMI
MGAQISSPSVTAWIDGWVGSVHEIRQMPQDAALGYRLFYLDVSGELVPMTNYRVQGRYCPGGDWYLRGLAQLPAGGAEAEISLSQLPPPVAVVSCPINGVFVRNVFASRFVFVFVFVFGPSARTERKTRKGKFPGCHQERGNILRGSSGAK